VAKDFLAHYLPSEIQILLDLNTLTSSKETFVDETLKAHYSNLLYHVKRASLDPIPLALTSLS
jgi:predicted transposase YdaD